MIYLDNAATTKLDNRVIEAMMPFITEQYGNPGGNYPLGFVAQKAVSEAREKVAEFLGCSSTQIIFTSGGSGANNLAIKGLKHRLSTTGKNKIVISSVEHDSVRRAAKALWARENFSIREIPVDKSGRVDLEDVLTQIDSDTGLVSIMYANNEVGAVNPIAEIGNELADRGILFHTDCVQAAGGYKLDMNRLPCDFASISSHKIHGPKGIGALFVRNPEILYPIIDGGKDQEFGLWGGTENVPAIVGFGEACRVAGSELEANHKYISELKTHFYVKFCEYMKDAGLRDIVSVNGGFNDSKILNLRLKGIHGSSMVLGAAAKNICISAGSACSSHEASPSHVLLAMGLSIDAARESFRVSFSKINGKEEVDSAAKQLAEIAKMVSELGPTGLWKSSNT